MKNIFNGKKQGLVLIIIGFCLLVIGAALAACAPHQVKASSSTSMSSLPTAISGVVVDANGSVLSGAIVQIKGTPNKTTTAKDGSFSLSGEGLGGTKLVTLTAWSTGHFVGWADLDPQKPVWQEGGKGIKITLKPLYTTDNNNYTWFEYEGLTGSASCVMCHFDGIEWQKDAHSQSAQNIRFITMYTGSNVQGQIGQQTAYTSDGKAAPIDPNQPYFGPGYKLDNPQRTGNCAACHTPLASTVSNQKNCSWMGCHTSFTVDNSKKVIDPEVNPVSLIGTAAEGITCEFCHKIKDVTLDPKTNLPYPDMPGILSLKLSRPSTGQQVFYGTIVDVNRRVSYLPLETQSQFCAACHYGVFGGVVGDGEVTGGTVIYNSYGEWLNSPYSNPKTGKTCQDCHMPVEPGVHAIVYPEKGGITRGYITINNHTMPGASDESLLKSAVTMKSSASHAGNQLVVNVSITNDKTGHDVPTDAPQRSVMLVVQAVDANGKQLALIQGPALPAWTGNYSGQPGKAFAKILRDDMSGETPTAAYWRPVTLIEDTRLAPFATDASNYTFALPDGQLAEVKVTLVYRREFQKLAQEKGYNDPDIKMAEDIIHVEK